MTNTSLAEVAAILKKSNNVAVACHVRPDGDALGSGLALCSALNNAGINAYMLCEEQPPERLVIFDGMQTYCELPVPVEEIDLFVSVDSADVARIGAFAPLFESFKGNTLNIDHHISNPGFAKYNYVLPDSTATCEILPEIFNAAGFEIDEKIANFLAMGLITDSGNFSHKDVSAKTFAVASVLRGKGADTSYIGYEMFTRQTKGRALLYAKTIGKMRFELDDKIVFITVTQSDFEETGTDKSHTEGFVDFGLSVDGVEVSVALMEVRRNQYKVSLRSKRADVNAVAEKFGGGGHILASGCMLCGEYEEVVDRLRYAISLQL